MEEFIKKLKNSLDQHPSSVNIIHQASLQFHTVVSVLTKSFKIENSHLIHNDFKFHLQKIVNNVNQTNCNIYITNYQLKISAIIINFPFQKNSQLPSQFNTFDLEREKNVSKNSLYMKQEFRKKIYLQQKQLKRSMKCVAEFINKDI